MIANICRFRSISAVNLSKPISHGIWYVGIAKLSTTCIALPDDIQRALEHALEDYPLKSVQKDASKLQAYIKARHPPLEKSERQLKLKEFQNEIKDNIVPEEEELVKSNQTTQNMLKKISRERLYNWQPLDFGRYEAIVYAFGRSALEYSALIQIFREISKRDRHFAPRTFFDFGSGVGSGSWAANTCWPDSISEWFNVDSSQAMNDLAKDILLYGKANGQQLLPNVFYRHFLPNLQTNYDLMLSAFSLFELPNREQRLKVLFNMWQKCVGYMIVVEEGSRRGSELVNEARDALLGLTEPSLQGHVFAPCPHSLRCPRHYDENDRTPCNFESVYTPPKITDIKKTRIASKYSYVVLKKSSIQKDHTQEWPRIVRPILSRSKHIVCRLCLPDATLKEIICTKSKNGRIAYQCLKESNWGDRVPIARDNAMGDVARHNSNE